MIGRKNKKADVGVLARVEVRGDDGHALERRPDVGGSFHVEKGEVSGYEHKRHLAPLDRLQEQ